MRELIVVFGTLGFIGFGGPAAHIALMRREVVERRGWLTDAQLVDLIGKRSWRSSVRSRSGSGSGR